MNFVIEHLSKRFEDKVVLRDICFTFTEGRIYGLLGRNGAGKTTLFNCLNRDLKADGGAFWSALESARELPELVVLDVMLPGIDGIELLRRMTAGAAR